MFLRRLAAVIRPQRRNLHRAAAVSLRAKPAEAASAEEMASAQAPTAEEASAQAGAAVSEAVASVAALAATPTAAATLAAAPVMAALAAGHIPAMALALQPGRRIRNVSNPVVQERFNFPSPLAAHHRREALPAR